MKSNLISLALAGMAMAYTGSQAYAVTTARIDDESAKRAAYQSAPSNLPVTEANNNDGSFGTTVDSYAWANVSTDYNNQAVSRANNTGGSGALKMTLVWDASNDLDLIVNQPDGSYIYYGSMSDSATGAQFGGDNTGGSGSAETVTWSNPTAGTYDVFVRVRGTVPSAGETVRLVIQSTQGTEVYSTCIKKYGSDSKDVRMASFRLDNGGGSSNSSSGSSYSVPRTRSSESSSSYSSGNVISTYVPANTTTGYDSDAERRAMDAPGSGSMKATLLWNFSNDCDLIVNNCNGTDLYYGNKTEDYGNVRHHGDDTGGSGWNCETVTWGDPKSGLYDIFIRVRGSVSDGLVKLVLRKNGQTTTYSTRITNTRSDGFTDFRLVQFTY